ncbi:MAG: ATP:cob(I)alamin adenosyltransferase [Prevotella sp.]|nr:ATP:cob(I)alamin adenosyltransferase [Prevotella sp.]
MKQIYTKTGDEGQTSLRGGVRVDKDDIRIETNGQIDHLNALLGVVRQDVPDELLLEVQRCLLVVMSHIATPEGQVNPRPLSVDDLTARMEQAIDRLSDRPVGFVVPEGMIHVARTQCRTVERRLWTLHRHYPVRPDVLRFFNRLSDYLFALAL